MQQQSSCDVPGQPREPIFRGDYTFNTGDTPGLGVVDYFIFIFIMLVSIVIGIKHAIEKNFHLELDDYLMAGRSMSALPVSLSLSASFLSGISMLGIPDEMYYFGTAFAWFMFGFLICIFISVNVYVPAFYMLGITSVYEVRRVGHFQFL
ncbi:sodium-coupled monocarboxylate transporter 1 [Plakobranchus ocellatus]|uniref:Sodium-coupled monocarboxylate transporter 1 n=1 Tax=Plakobranchus ocellatus TaxID=259542 RepID=A0AAV4BZ06_9GAST|nr:sodium-coupled monocarboxylate transporter 1 [Plakobranchus ocellatus]